MHFLLRIRNAAQLVTVSTNEARVKVGKDMDNVEIIKNGTVIVNEKGLIEDIGPDAEMASKYDNATFDTDIDATGKAVIPGLCDGHTHPVWTGDRVHEFAMKLAGATYMDVHKAGGGINFTVRKTREASEDELLELLNARVKRMGTHGTTLIEAKSGYGLDTETELKMLRCIHRAKEHTSLDLVANYLGAHSVPQGKTAAEAAKDCVENQIPAIVKSNKEGKTSVELIDVFCEKGVFEREDSRKILKAGKDAGMLINFHGDELNPLQSGELAGELDALAVSHLEHLSEEGIKAMSSKGIVGVLLPTTAYLLHLVPPPARKMIEGNVPVALGSDYNPNAHCMSMPFVMNLACVTMGMTMNEALVASTLNSAASMNRATTHGSLEVGKCGDFVVLNADNWEHLIYQLVDPPIQSVIKNGVVIHGLGAADTGKGAPTSAKKRKRSASNEP